MQVRTVQESESQRPEHSIRACSFSCTSLVSNQSRLIVGGTMSGRRTQAFRYGFQQDLCPTEKCETAVNERRTRLVAKQNNTRLYGYSGTLPRRSAHGFVAKVSVRFDLEYSFCNVGNLRKYCIFELRHVRDERVERAHALHRSVEIFEELVCNARGDLRAVPK